MRTIVCVCGTPEIQPRSAPTPSQPLRDAHNVHGTGAQATGAAGQRPGTLPVASQGSRTWVGEGGPADSFSPFLLQLVAGLLCFSFSAGRVRRLAALAAAPSLPGLSRLLPDLFSFPSFLAWLPFFQASGSLGKVASPSLPKSSASLGGGSWELGVCESAIDPRSSGGLAPASPASQGRTPQPAPAGLRVSAPRGGMSTRTP